MGRVVRRAIDDIHILAVQNELVVGDRLPSERELAQELMVSRSTIRAALAQMRNQGEIVTGPGREGSVIAADIAHMPSQERIEVNAKSARLIERPSGSADGVPSMLASQGLVCETTMLDVRICECHEGICRAFGFRGAAPLARVERRRTVLGEPLSFEQTYVNQRAYPHFLSLDLTQSISQLLQVECGAQVTAVQEMIRVVPAFGRCARCLCCMQCRAQSVEMGALWCCRMTCFPPTGCALPHPEACNRAASSSCQPLRGCRWRHLPP